MKNEGLLKDLDLKKGDVVEVVRYPYRNDDYQGWRWVFDGVDKIVAKEHNNIWNPISTTGWIYRVVSRALPPPWEDLSPEEKGALLLAHYEGKAIQFWHKHSTGWENRGPSCVMWWGDYTYRIKPSPIIEKMTVSWEDHSITFNKVDGVPDCASIKMEAK